MIGTQENMPLFEEVQPGMKEAILQLVPMPAQCGANGLLHSGWLMGQMDLAGGEVVRRFARQRHIENAKVMTVAVDCMEIAQPLDAKKHLNVRTEVVNLGRKTITMEITVEAQAQGDGQGPSRVAEAYFTYALVDGAGKPLMLGDGAA